MGGGGVLITLALSFLLGCPQNVDESEAGWGINAFPESESFTREITNLPNPLVSWQGNNVTADNWDLRRDEIAQIMQHYELGYKLSAEGVSSTVTTVGEETMGSRPVTITVTRGTASAPINFALALPSTPPPEGGYPVIMDIGMSWGEMVISMVNSAEIAGRGYAKLTVGVGSIDSGDSNSPDTNFSSATHGGAVGVLYPEVRYFSGNPQSKGLDAATNRYKVPWIDDYGDPDAPGLMINYAWGVSRIIDAIETDAALPVAQRRLNLNPQKIAITGMSRWGKTALIAGAFDTRIAVVNPVSTGGGGTPVDRFVSVSVNEADSKIDGPYGPYPGGGNKAYQYLKTGDLLHGTRMGRVVTAAEALINPAIDPDGGGNADWGSAADDHQRTAEDGTNIKQGYTVHAYGVEFDGPNFRFQGPQGLPDIRWGYPQYWNSRFHQIPILYQNQNTHARPQRGDWGYMSTQPFDQHYLTSLVAPRTLLIHDGFISTNTSPEGSFMTFLATREVYRVLNKEGNIGIAIYVIGHAQPEVEVIDLLDVCDAVYAGRSIPSRLTPNSLETYPFPINDPRSKFDYLKLDWAAPGYESIASQVKKLVP